jgi:hypothetical protein
VSVFAWRFFDVQDNVVRSRANKFEWPAPGEWAVHKGEPKLCASGFHGCRTLTQALRERQGTTLGLVEADEIGGEDETKFTARRMRIVTVFERERLVAFACLAARCVLPLFARKRPNDDRPQKAISLSLQWVAQGGGGGLRPSLRQAASEARQAAYAAADAYAAAAYAYAAAAYAAAYADADAADADAAAYADAADADAAADAAAAAAAAYAAAAYAADAAAYAAAYAYAAAARKKLRAFLDSKAQELVSVPLDMLAEWVAGVDVSGAL